MQEAYSEVINRYNPAMAYTLDDFVALKEKDNTTYRNFSILDVENGIEFVDHCLFDEYLDYIEQLSVDTELTDEEFERYKYKPDLLAYEVYGSVQLDYFILLMNGMSDPKDFDRKTIKMMRTNILQEFLNEVMQYNSGYIAQNRIDYNINT